jgi:hypothetical protein
MYSQEIPLAGGRVTPGVVRVGDTVRRPIGAHSAYVHELLRYLETVDFGGAPRLLGVDEQGREILTFIEGIVPHDFDSHPLSDAQLASAAALIRRFHDATAGSSLAGDAEIVCHNELGPHNTVYVGAAAVAFIDWDAAAPGTRLYDLANAIWCYVNIGESGGSLPVQAQRMRLICDTYGWDDTDAIVDTITADLRQALANHQRAERAEAVRIFQEMVDWMIEHGAALKTLSRRDTPIGRADQRCQGAKGARGSKVRPS